MSFASRSACASRRRRSTKVGQSESARRYSAAASLGGRELAEVVIDDAEHVVHVGEHHAARDGLLQMAGRERIIAALEVLSAEGDQLPQLVVHALPVDCWVESVPWITRRTAKAAEFRATSADWPAAPGWARADSWEPRASRLRAVRSAQGPLVRPAERPGSAPPAAAHRARRASPRGRWVAVRRPPESTC